MITKFIDLQNFKTTSLHNLVLNLTNKIHLRKGDTTVVLSNFSINYTWKNIKKSYKTNMFTISGPTQDEELELPGGSYSVSNLQNYFKYIIKKHEALTDNPLMQVCINRIENRITF